MIRNIRRRCLGSWVLSLVVAAGLCLPLDARDTAAQQKADDAAATARQRERNLRAESHSLSPGSETEPRLKPPTGFNSAIPHQERLHGERLTGVEVITDPNPILEMALQDYGRGRAGGISLHTAAEMLTPLDMGRVSGIFFEQNRFYLLYGNQKIAFPPLDPDHFAVAVRTLYDDQGIIGGKLVADESNAVVVQTGPEQLRELVWRKEFLAEPWKPVPIGERVELSLGPAIGLLATPEPSVQRVIYYGPIKDTRMGNILLAADGVLVALQSGIDWKTGLPVQPPKINGYMTILERRARRSLSDPKAKLQPAPQPLGSEGWWSGTIWLVWVPERISLKLASDRSQFQFVDVKMKLSTWTVGKEKVEDGFRELGEHATTHYEDLARAFPVLRDLKEVAKAVAVARWLKKNRIAVDVQWAWQYPVSPRKSPDHIRSFTVHVGTDDFTGKAVFEK